MKKQEMEEMMNDYHKMIRKMRDEIYAFENEIIEFAEENELDEPSFD